jgi:thioredoxin-related protein
MFRRLLLTISVFLGITLHAQEENHGLVKWLTFKEAQEEMKKQPKPLLIDIYTDWCGWCKHMIKTTYSDPNVASYINTYFYPVQFNAETHDTIEYNGEKYVNRSSEKKSPHDLAIKFLGQSLSYPSTVFVANNYQFNLLSQGYLETKKIEPLLVFIVENAFRTASFDDFSKNFTHTFTDTVFVKKQPKTYTFQEALELQKKHPKKILVTLYTDFCNTCRVMNQTTFTDTALVSYLNKKYYLVKFNAQQEKSEIDFKGIKYANNGAGGFPFHALALELTRKNFVIPGMVFLDEKLETLDVVSFYQTAEWTNKIAHYFGSDDYKKMKWDEFLKKNASTGGK